jgi:zinc and cadmium transporter
MIQMIKGQPLGILLAISGGALIYVGASHLLPEVEKERNRHGLAVFFAGVLAGVIMVVMGA